MKTTLRFALVASVATALAFLFGERQSPAQPMPTPIRLIVEAEDFKPEKGDWQVKEFGTNYFANTLAVTFLSRGRYLSAPEQGVESVAVKEIEIPAEREYQVWSRFEQPYDYAVQFELAIEQSDKLVATVPYGRKDDKKLWAFKKGFEAQVLWDWGGGDNIVWQRGEEKVKLAKGKARLILKKGPQNVKQSARRNVDLVMLTNDQHGVEKQLKEAKYLPLDGWLTQDGDLEMVVTNPKENDFGLMAMAGPCVEHSPYHVHVREWPKRLWIGKETGDKPIDKAKFLQPKDASEPAQVGGFLDSLNDCQWKVYFQCDDGKPAAGRKVQLAFRVSTADGKVKVIRDEVFTIGPDNSVSFHLDSGIRNTQRIRTVEEDLETLAKYVKELPKKGKRPEKYLIYGLMGFSNALNEKGRVGELSKEIAQALGSNTLPDVKTPAQNGLIDVRSIATKDLKAYCEKLKQDNLAERIKVVSLGDEIQIGGTVKSPDDDPAFRDFLKQRGLKPEDVGLKSLEDAKIDLATKESKLYYHSHVFSMERGIAQYKERTDILEANLPKGVVTGANYSPHPHYWPKEGQWIRTFQRRAMTLPWSEDYVWQVPEASDQINGYMLAALRCGAKYHDLPIHWYVMPHAPGQTPDNLRRAYYTAIAHGAKQLNFFCASPLSVAQTENYVRSDAKDTWRTIRELVHETGEFERITFDAKPRKAEVGLLISFAQDLWDPDPLANHERKCLYLALRHGGMAVDFVTEDDIQNGRHKQFKTIYLVGDHLEKAAAKALKDWVKQGGVLAGFAGGGFRDEHNQPLDELKVVYGIEKQTQTRKAKVVMTKMELPRLEPLDTVAWPVGTDVVEFPALAFKQTMETAKGAGVLAKYKDGGAAVVTNPFGKGHAYLFGTLVGSAYVRPAIPLRPYDRGATPESFNHFLPTNFSGDLNDIITGPAAHGEVRFNIIINEPLVETTVLEGPNGYAVALVNWTPKPQEVLVTIQYLPKGFDKATSIHKGALKTQRIAETLTFKLKVDVADMVLVEK